jgi:hypothetical protein
MNTAIHKNKFSRYSPLFGLIGAVFYSLFTIISWILFPNPATPMDHWLSDFGRKLVPGDGSPVWLDGSTIWDGVDWVPNPGGWAYNLACIGCGIFFLVFAYSFYTYRDAAIEEKHKKVTKIFTYLLVVFGVLLCIALIGNGVFYEDFGPTQYSTARSIFSKMIFISMLPFMALSGIWAKWVGLPKYLWFIPYAILIVDIVVVFTGNQIAIAEWISVFTGHGLMICFAISMWKKNKIAAS